MATDESGPTLRQIGVRDVTSGPDVTIVAPSNVYGATLGEGTFVGPFCEIQQGVVIGKRCRIQSHSFICELVTIGDDCAIAHGVMFVNDLFRGGPARGDRAKWAHTAIADRVSIGSNATILPVRICSDVVVGAGSVVTKDITVAGTYAGNPARRLN